VRLRVRVRVRACRIPADVERLKQLKHVVVVFAIPRHANYRNAYASNAWNRRWLERRPVTWWRQGRDKLRPLAGVTSNLHLLICHWSNCLT